jgi:hypothetical protein
MTPVISERLTRSKGSDLRMGYGEWKGGNERTRTNEVKEAIQTIRSIAGGRCFGASCLKAEQKRAARFSFELFEPHLVRSVVSVIYFGAAKKSSKSSKCSKNPWWAWQKSVRSVLSILSAVLGACTGGYFAGDAYVPRAPVTSAITRLVE